MRYRALACDYDGTLASRGVVEPATADALESVRASGRKLVLVTGRQVPDLLKLFPRADLFDRIVAENGAVVSSPSEGTERTLAGAAPQRLVTALRNRGVTPLSVGRVIVATNAAHERAVLDAIEELGIGFHLILNKGSVMVLPAGIDKATGLEAALRELGISRHSTVGVGDAENDLAFLRWCGYAVAVANALPAVKADADLVTLGEHGAGVVELIRDLVARDPSGSAPLAP